MALKRIGALWNKADKKGKDYYSGVLDLGALGEARIMVFKNDKREGQQPDFSIHLATDNPQSVPTGEETAG